MKSKHERNKGSSLFGGFKRFLNVIEKVADGEIDGYRYVAFEITPDEREKVKHKACEYAAEVVEDILREYDVPEEEIRRVVDQVSACMMDVSDVLDRYDIEPDYYYPTIDELAAEIVLGKALHEVPDAPPDPEVSEEPGYGLPEYSLYWGADARSWVGRWYWSYGGSEDVCFGLITKPEVCRKASKLVDNLDYLAKRKGRELLFAIWKKD